MRSVTIAQFRATLDRRTEQSALVRAYRELARRPALAARTEVPEWAAWPPAATRVAEA